MAAYGGPVPVSKHNNTPQPTTGYGIKPKQPKVNWAAMAADPKTRAKVPDGILKKVNPAAYQQRQTNQYNQAPITYGSSTTNRQLAQDTQAAIGLKYGSADQQLQQQYAQSAAMQQQIPHWFDYYREQVKGLQQQANDATKGAYDTITNTGGTLAAAASRAAGADQGAMQADAAIRGATVDPAAVQRATQASAVNTSSLADAAALQTLQGNNQNSYWLGQQGVSEQAKVQALMGEANYRRNNIDSQAAQIAAEKGDYGTTYKTGRVSDERQAVLENQAFGLNQAKAASDAASKLASLDLAAKKARQQARIEKTKIAQDAAQNATSAAQKERQLGISQQNADANTTRANKPATVKKTPKLTVGQRAKVVSQITTLTGFFQQRVWPEGPGKGKPATLAELKRHYQLAGVDPRIIRVAESLYRNGGSAIGPYGAQQAKNLGIPVKGNWKVVGAKKKAGG